MVINELGIAPSSGNFGGGSEFVELYNNGGCNVNIGCYVLVFSSTATNILGSVVTGWTITIPANTPPLAPGSYYLIGGGGIANPTSIWQPSTGGNPWSNTPYGSNGRSPDLSISTSSNSAKNNIPGLLTDQNGQVTLLNPLNPSVPVASVSYNSGNTAATYPNSFSNPPANCTPISPIPDLGPSPFNINYNPPNGFNSFAQGIYFDVSGNYQVAFRNPDGTSNLTPGKPNISQLVYTPPTPLIAGSHNTDPVTACLNYNPASLTFTGYTPPSGGVSPYTYQWKLNGVNISGATSDSYDPPNLTIVGSYDYNVEITDVCGTKVSTAVKRITIVNEPSVAISGGGTFCQGSTVTLTSTVTNGVGPFFINGNLQQR